MVNETLLKCVFYKANNQRSIHYAALKDDNSEAKKQEIMYVACQWAP